MESLPSAVAGADEVGPAVLVEVGGAAGKDGVGDPEGGVAELAGAALEHELRAGRRRDSTPSFVDAKLFSASPDFVSGEPLAKQLGSMVSAASLSCPGQK